jgi:hypothetical protein
MDDREKLAADLLWAERCIQRCRDPAVVTAAKRWLAELEWISRACDPAEVVAGPEVQAAMTAAERWSASRPIRRGPR